MGGFRQQGLTWEIGRLRGRVGAAVIGALSVLALLLGAGAARASVTLTSLSETPSTTEAGGHPDLTIAAHVSYSDSTDDLKSLQVFLPAGLIGNPSVVTKCTSSQLSSDGCPSTSKIGTVSVTANAAGISLPVTAPGDVYAVTPTGTEPARIGMVVRPAGGVLGKFSMSGPATIRIPGDFGLTTTFDNLPRTLPPILGLVPIPITITAISLTLNGLVNGGSAAFVTNPTSCSPAGGGGLATSYESATPSGAFTGFTPTDCANEPFDPSISFNFDTPRASTPAGLTVGITMPGNDLPRAQADLRTNVVILPVGTTLNPGLFTGLVPCTDAQLNVSSAAAPACPASSQVGTVAFTTPLLGTLPGAVYFAAATPTRPLGLFITININGAFAKFVATNSLSGANILTTLSNLPQVPFTSFALSFHGGANALVDTPPCGPTAGIGGFFPWSGPFGKFSIGPVTITQTTAGAPCP